VVCEAAGFTKVTEAAANPIANAERRSTLSIVSSRTVTDPHLADYRIVPLLACSLFTNNPAVRVGRNGRETLAGVRIEIKLM
jgi:hypothetical protein